MYMALINRRLENAKRKEQISNKIGKLEGGKQARIFLFANTTYREKVIQNLLGNKIQSVTILNLRYPLHFLGTFLKLTVGGLGFLPFSSKITILHLLNNVF